MARLIVPRGWRSSRRLVALKATAIRARASKAGIGNSTLRQIAVVFGRNPIILLSQLQPLLILSLVDRPVYLGGPSPFQGSWR